MFNLLVTITPTDVPVGSIVSGPLFAPLQESENMISDGAAALLFAGAFFTVGVVMLYSSAWKRILDARKYLGMEVFNPTTDVDDDSLLAARGSVTASDGSVSGPLTGENCVAFVREDSVLERKITEDTSNVNSTGNHSNDDGTKVMYSWEIRDATQESVPFEVETSHGPVAVEPGYAELDLPVQDSDATFLGTRILYHVPVVGRLITRPTKTVEKHLKPGDTVTVIGDIQPADSADGPVGSVHGGGGRGEFTVTDKSGTSLAARSIVSAVLASLPALLCFIIAVGAIAIAVATGALP